MGFVKIHEQLHADSCSACALAAIAEDVVQEPVDCEFLYQNSSDGTFGINPKVAMNSVIINGVRLLSDGTIHRLFTGYSQVKRQYILFGSYSFDSLKQELKSGPLFCGCYWQTGWADLVDGVIPTNSKNEPVAPHAFKVVGIKVIHSEDYLVIQNSRGEGKGDRGYWYMPRSVANNLRFAYKLIK